MIQRVFLYYPYIFPSMPFLSAERKGDREAVIENYPFYLFKTYKITAEILEFWVKGGRNQGIREGAFVLDRDGRVIGKVMITRDNYSLVRSVYHPQFKVPAKIKETSIVGTLSGTGDGAVFSFPLEEGEPPSRGELVTLEFEGFSFPGLYLGDIERIIFDPETREGKGFLGQLSFEPRSLYIILGE